MYAIKAIKGLTVYAERLAIQPDKYSFQKIARARRIINELSIYWDIDEDKDWEAEFDMKIRKAELEHRATQFGRSEKNLAVIGLFEYAKEMISAQGWDERERIEEVVQIIRQMGVVLGMMEKFYEEYINKIEIELNQLSKQLN